LIFNNFEKFKNNISAIFSLVIRHYDNNNDYKTYNKCTITRKNTKHMLLFLYLQKLETWKFSAQFYYFSEFEHSHNDYDNMIVSIYTVNA